MTDDEKVIYRAMTNMTQDERIAAEVARLRPLIIVNNNTQIPVYGSWVQMGGTWVKQHRDWRYIFRGGGE